MRHGRDPQPASGRRRVWVTCDECGDVDLDVCDATLRFAKHSGMFSVTYACARCGRRDLVDIRDPKTLGALFDAGLVPISWELLSERYPVAGPLTLDAVDAAASLLAQPGWIEANAPRR